MIDQHSIDEDDHLVRLTRENKARVRVVLDQMHARAAQPFGCGECRHLGSDGDGYEYNGTWPVCERYRGLGEPKAFPFKVAPSCFEINPDCSPVAALTYVDYPDAASGAFAVSNAMDAYGRVSQFPLDDAAFDEVFEVLVDPIVWDDEGEGHAGARWRGMSGGAYPADEKVRRQPGYADAYVAYVGGADEDYWVSDRKKPWLAGFENAKRHAEVQMRLLALRLVIAGAGERLVVVSEAVGDLDQKQAGHQRGDRALGDEAEDQPRREGGVASPPDDDRLLPQGGADLGHAKHLDGSAADPQLDLAAKRTEAP